MPAKSGESSWRTALRRPCIGSGAATTAAPHSSAEALVAKADAEQWQGGAADRLGADAEVPGAVGPPGPGEMTTLSKPSATAPSQLASSLRTTSGSSPFASASSWKRL